MLNIEILDQIERANRWRQGPRILSRGRTFWSSSSAGQAYGGHTSGGQWIAGDSFLMGVHLNNVFQTWRYVLSTDTVSVVSASIGPQYPMSMPKEEAGGTIWLQDAAAYGVYTYNPAGGGSLTLRLSQAAMGLFVYDPAGTLYYRDASANWYTCINGAMTVTTAPSGVRLPTAPEYNFVYNKNRYLTQTAELELGQAVALQMRRLDTTVMNLIRRRISPQWSLLMTALAATSMVGGHGTSGKTLGTHNHPYRHFMTPVWVEGVGMDYSLVCAGVMSMNFNAISYQVAPMLYDTVTDRYSLLPHCVLQQHQNDAGDSTFNPSLPQVARLYGDHIKLWMITANNMSAAGDRYLFLNEISIPL